MRKVCAFIFRLFGGIDMSCGVLIYTIVSLMFEQEFSWAFFLLTLAAIHAPDGDLIPYAFIRNRLKYPSHWIIGHHPIIIIPLGGLVGWFIGDWYGLTLAIVAIFFHFVHDSMAPQGLHWLSPFTWRSVSLQGLQPRIISKKQRTEILERVKDGIKRDGEILSRMPPLARIEIIFSAISWLELIVFVLF